MRRFDEYSRKVTKNYTKTVYVLKCDIKKFCASIDHEVLTGMLKIYIPDKDILWLLDQIISSFNPGLPLGNLTSHLLVNMYMNEFDQYAKRNLKIKYYIRYADDFVILHGNREYLENLIKDIKCFLENCLKLKLHSSKIYIKPIHAGVDWLGWVHFEKHKVLRAKTKQRMLKKLNKKNQAAYMGLLKHGDGWNLQCEVVEKCR